MPKHETIPSPAQEPPAHTLSSIAEALGEPDLNLEAALLEGATDAALVRVGRTVASSHIVVDATRLYGVAFDVWTHATAAQKEVLRGFSPELLAIGVAHAQKLAAMVEAHDARHTAADASRESRGAAARAIFTAGLTLRDQAAKVLRGVAGQDAALITAVNAAVGTADTGVLLAKGLKSLAAIGKKMLGNKKGAPAQRAKLMRVDDAYIASLEAASARVSDAVTQAGARAAGKAVTQGALDREDGVNAIILKHIIDVFEAAHDIDPTIPRLVPLATRRLFNRYRKAAKPGEEGEEGEAAGSEEAVEGDAADEGEGEEAPAEEAEEAPAKPAPAAKGAAASPKGKSEAKSKAKAPK